MNYSFGLLKPDCLERGLVEQAFGLIEKQGLRIVFQKKHRLSIQDVFFLYQRCIGKEFFGIMTDFLTSNDSLLYVVVSETEIDVPKLLNHIVGETNPTKAEPNTLRSLGESICRNIAHSAENHEVFLREVGHFLNKEERIRIGLDV